MTRPNRAGPPWQALHGTSASLTSSSRRSRKSTRSGRGRRRPASGPCCETPTISDGLVGLTATCGSTSLLLYAAAKSGEAPNGHPFRVEAPETLMSGPKVYGLAAAVPAAMTATTSATSAEVANTALRMSPSSHKTRQDTGLIRASSTLIAGPIRRLKAAAEDESGIRRAARSSVERGSAREAALDDARSRSGSSSDRPRGMDCRPPRRQRTSSPARSRPEEPL